jgi:integrase
MAKAAARKVVLTDRALKALRPAPAGKRYWVWDAATSNLGVRVTDKGHRSFIVVRRRPGDQQPFNHVIGSYPAVTLADARKQAPDALSAIVAGRTPGEVERERLRSEARKRKDTFAGVAEDFIKLHVNAKGEDQLRRAKEYESIVRRELIDRWGKRTVTSIDRRDVVEMLDEIKARSTYAAHHTFAAARKLFNWAIDRDTYGIEQNPCSLIRAKKAIGKPKKRSRVLTDDELKLVWDAAKLQGDRNSPPALRSYPFGTLLQLLLLTGQRLREIASARWDEIDLDAATLTVSGERMKAKRDHVVPLTPRAFALLSSAPRFKDGAFVFTTTAGKRPVSGFSKVKDRLDATIADLVEKSGQKRAVPPFTLHDLRRTVRTRLSTLGVTPFIAELVIAHTQGGVHEVYDLHTYDGEKRDALQRWEQLLLSIVEPSPRARAKKPPDAKVIPMRKSARR